MWIKKKKTHIFGVIFIGKNIFFYKKKCLPKCILQRKFPSFSLNFPKNLVLGKKKNFLTSQNFKMSSGFTHEENVLKATCSFESETLFTTVTKNSWEDYMINMFLTIFCVNLLWSSLSDGMTVFSPVSSARYRRSSVSINPSCPSQVGVIISGDIFTVCFSFSSIVSSSSSAARSSLTFLPDRRQTRPQETGEDRNISLLLLSTVGTITQEVFMSPDQRV